MNKEWIDEFINHMGREKFDIYNEAGLQHELALFLRPRADQSGFKLQLERNIEFFGITDLPKSEMDIVVFSPDKMSNHCVELKVPLQGAVPERMFQFCIDLAFLEGLKQNGFSSGTAIMVTSDRGFWHGDRAEGLYGAFRRGFMLTGKIMAPVRRGGLQEVALSREYRLTWRDLFDGWRCLVVNV